MTTRDVLIEAVAEVLVGVNAQPFDLVLDPGEARVVAERVVDRLGIEHRGQDCPTYRDECSGDPGAEARAERIAEVRAYCGAPR